MAQRPDLDDRLIRLAYEVRDLVQGGKYAKMQELVEAEALRRGLQPWDLARQLADVGLEKGIATPIQVLPEGSSLE